LQSLCKGNRWLIGPVRFQWKNNVLGGMSLNGGYAASRRSGVEAIGRPLLPAPETTTREDCARWKSVIRTWKSLWLFLTCLVVHLLFRARWLSASVASRCHGDEGSLIRRPERDRLRRPFRVANGVMGTSQISAAFSQESSGERFKSGLDWFGSDNVDPDPSCRRIQEPAPW